MDINTETPGVATLTVFYEHEQDAPSVQLVIDYSTTVMAYKRSHVSVGETCVALRCIRAAIHMTLGPGTHIVVPLTPKKARRLADEFLDQVEAELSR